MSAKDTKGKPKLSLIPYTALEQIAKVREFGVNKYGDDTCWKDVPEKEFLEATLRHVYKYLNGNDTDEESGLSHLAHAATSLTLAMALKTKPDSSIQNAVEEAFGVLSTEQLNGNVWEGTATYTDLQSCYDDVTRTVVDEYELVYDDSRYDPTQFPRRRK
jgi:hypothetical protein